MNRFWFARILFLLLGLSFLGEGTGVICESAGKESALLARQSGGSIDRSEPPRTDGCAAIVNGEVITHRQLTRMATARRLPKKDILQELIFEKLILQAAKKDEIKISDEELEEHFNNDIKRTGGREKFEKEYLSSLEMSYQEYRQNLRDQLIEKKYILKKTSQMPLDKSAQIDFIIDTYITPHEVKEFIKRYQKELQGKEQIKTRQIILFFDDRTKVLKKEMAEKIMNELKNGADFSGLAQQYSEVKAKEEGLWDWTPQGTFPKEVEEIIFSLKMNDVSPLIETTGAYPSYRIVRIEDRMTPMDNLNSPELQEKVQNLLYNKKFNEGLLKIKEELMKSAHIWTDPALGTEQAKTKD